MIKMFKDFLIAVISDIQICFKRKPIKPKVTKGMMISAENSWLLASRDATRLNQWIRIATDTQFEVVDY